MKLTIKNMVCRHCMDCVRHVLVDELGLPLLSLELGAAVIDCELEGERLQQVADALVNEGFELIQSREAEIVDTIKRVLIDFCRRDGVAKESFSDILVTRFNLSYPSLSRIFSEIEGRSIENYYMMLRVERVKELIKYCQLSFSEIADQLGYSSVAHLSRQFKQYTGLTPSQFREMGRRRPLPEV